MLPESGQIDLLVLSLILDRDLEQEHRIQQQLVATDQHTTKFASNWVDHPYPVVATHGYTEDCRHHQEMAEQKPIKSTKNKDVLDM